jgi:hypothetical protein
MAIIRGSNLGNTAWKGLVVSVGVATSPPGVGG